MSFWDNVKKFAQPYADDEYDDYDDDDEMLDDYDEPEEPVRRPARPARRAPAPAPAPAAPVSDYEYGYEEDDDFGFAAAAPAAAPVSAPVSTGFSGQVLNVSSGKQEVVLFHPSTFNDTSKAADDLRNKKAVIVNMENVDKAMARRVVDFLSGCVYALDGTVKKIAQSAYLFCPHNMDVLGDLENLQAEVESYI